MSLFCVYVQPRNEFIISVVSRVGVVLGLKELSATWDSDFTDRAITLVWSSEDFLRGFNCYSFCIVLCFNNELRENFFFNLSRKFVRVASSKKCHRILPHMSHITKKLYSAKNTKVKNDMSIFHLARLFSAINNVRQWNATQILYQSDQVFLCCRHSYLRLFLFYVHRFIPFSFLFVYTPFLQSGCLIWHVSVPKDKQIPPNSCLIYTDVQSWNYLHLIILSSSCKLAVYCNLSP